MQIENEDLKELIERLKKVQQMGWVQNRRKGNDGGVGNTLEDLIGVEENNFPIADFKSWELKSQRATTTSLLTLFHSEPLPRTAGIVPKILLPIYGWPHDKAGTEYQATERSFRATLNYTHWSVRGLKVDLDDVNKRLTIEFDPQRVDSNYQNWLVDVKAKGGYPKMSVTPYFAYSDIQYKLDKKLKNTLYCQAQNKAVNGVEYFKYDKFVIYCNPTLDNFLKLVKEGVIYVDFDARTGHNHGTKIRIQQNRASELYSIKETI